MSLKKKQKIVLIHAKTKNAIDFFSTKTSNELDYWIYLGKNIRLFSEIEKIIEGRIKRIDTGESLQDTARKLRKPYIDFIGSIAQKENKIAWILTSISEKNVYGSDLFLMLCYLETLNHEIKKYPGGICVFCDNPTLIRNIQKNLKTHTDLEVEVQDCDPISKTFPQLILERFKSIHNKVSFFRYFAGRIFQAKMLQIRNISGQNIPTNEPVIAIHSWTDQRSFIIEGSFSEPYFGNLGQILEKNNTNSFYVIHVLGTISYPEALKKLSKMKVHWKLFEDFLEFSDIIRAMYLAGARKREETTDIYFSGYEISELLNEEYERDRHTENAERVALFYFAARRMAQQFSLKTFIYTFENHIWERMAIEGIRELSPNTKIVVYAHTRVDKMYLCYSRSIYEKKMNPIPDIILVNGPQAKENLLESGFKDADIQIIGSLRYGNLTFMNKRENSERRYEILVVLSCDLDRSLEMIFKCVNAFSGTGNLAITFKPHPIINPESMIKSVGSLPEIFSFSSKSISTLFETANLVIYCDSTASVEAACRGIPVLHIKSAFTININIFEDVEIIPSVSSPEQIRIQSLKILDGEYPAFEEIQTYVEQIFSRVDEQKIVEIIS